MKEERYATGANVLKYLAFLLLFVVVLTLVFWVLMIAAYLIPTDAIKGNVQTSLDVLSREGLFPSSFINNGSYDNFTVSLMLNEAMGEGNPFLASLSNFYVLTDGDQLAWLAAALDGENTSLSTQDVCYARYWHGYLIVVKPLLVFFDLAEIRMIFQLAFTVVVMVAIWKLIKALKSVGVCLSAALVLSFVLIDGWNTVATLPLFFSFFIAVAAICWASSVAVERPYAISFGFVLIGASTIFFDFLDNPILTLGIPMAVLLTRVVYAQQTQGIGLVCLKLALIAGASWLFGYAGLWVMKWLLALLVLGSGVALGIVDAATLWSGSDVMLEGRVAMAVEAIRVNFRDLGIIRWGLMLVVVLSVFMALIVKNKKLTIAMIALAVIAAIPYIWYAGMAQHSIMHHGSIAYRTQFLTLFCWLSLFLMSVDMLRQNRVQRSPAHASSS